jgi:amidase
MARYVDDLELVLPVLCGPDGRDPSIVPMPLGNPGAVDISNLRVSFHTDNGIVPVDSTIADCVRAAAGIIEAEGASVDEIRPEGIEEAEEIYNNLFTADGGGRWLRQLQQLGTSRIKERWLRKLKISSLSRYIETVNRWDTYRKRMYSFIQRYDVIISPVNGLPALSADDIDGGDRIFSYARAYNLTGWPCAVVRGGTSDRALPIGVQVVAAPWREDIVLAVARRLERSLLGFQPPPEPEDGFFAGRTGRKHWWRRLYLDMSG